MTNSERPLKKRIDDVLHGREEFLRVEQRNGKERYYVCGIIRRQHYDNLEELASVLKIT